MAKSLGTPMSERWLRMYEIQRLLRYNNGIAEDLRLREELFKVGTELEGMLRPPCLHPSDQYVTDIVRLPPNFEQGLAGQKPHTGHVSTCFQGNWMKEKELPEGF